MLEYYSLNLKMRAGRSPQGSKMGQWNWRGGYSATRREKEAITRRKPAAVRRPHGEVREQTQEVALSR